MTTASFRTAHTTAVLLLLIPVITWAQRKPLDQREHERLGKNERGLQVSITTDRKVYFPGERFSIELAVVNPTPGTLEVRDPFERDSAAIDMQVKNDKVETGWAWMDAHLRRDRLHRSEANVVLHASSQTLKYTLKNRYTLPGDPFPVSDIGYTVPHEVGEYRLCYAYGLGATAEFTVVPMKVETLSDIVLQRRTAPSKNILGVSSTAPLQYHVMALEGDGSHWIVVSVYQSILTTSELRLRNGLVIASDVRKVSPIVRIAKSDVPIKSITGTADEKENLDIRWTDANGKVSRITLDQSKKDSWALPPTPKKR